MTIEELGSLDAAVEELKKLQGGADTETAHGTADGILCGLLESLGCGAAVEEYDKIRKWYA